MKKILTILAINLILFIIFLLCAEAYSYKKTLEANRNNIKTEQQTLKNQDNSFNFKKAYAFAPKFADSEFVKQGMHRVNYRKSNKKAIIFFGCSFTQGAQLKDKQTLAYKISRISNRTTDNRGKGATGTQFMYYQLIDKNLKHETPDAEYIIYTFIWDHLYRLNTYIVNPGVNVINIRYKIVNNKLVEIKPAFTPLYSSYIVKKVQFDIVSKKFAIEQENFLLFNAIMKESIKIAQKKYPHSKFIILEYPENIHKKKLPQSEIDKLENMGYIVINTEKLIGHNLNDKKYRTEDGYHPSEAAWNEVAPKLVQKLKL